MTGQKKHKLNQLLAELADGWLVTPRWLQARGCSRSLVGQYVQQGWLASPARGVFCRRDSRLSWQGVVFSLQHLQAMPLHVGGRHALTLHGMDHYLRLGPAPVTLSGPARLPAWTNRLKLEQPFTVRPDAKLGLPALSPALLHDRDALRAAGLETLPGDRPSCPVVVSMPERAILELLLDTPERASIAEADAVLQGMAGLRPALLSRLLRDCRSIKVKRLFLALAERHGHAWFTHLDLENVDLGRGKRMITRGGRLHPKYQITLPDDLDEQLV